MEVRTFKVGDSRGSLCVSETMDGIDAREAAAMASNCEEMM